MYLSIRLNGFKEIHFSCDCLQTGDSLQDNLLVAVPGHTEGVPFLNKKILKTDLIFRTTLILPKTGSLPASLFDEQTKRELMLTHPKPRLGYPKYRFEGSVFLDGFLHGIFRKVFLTQQQLARSHRQLRPYCQLFLKHLKGGSLTIWMVRTSENVNSPLSESKKLIFNWL